METNLFFLIVLFFLLLQNLSYLFITNFLPKCVHKIVAKFVIKKANSKKQSDPHFDTLFCKKVGTKNNFNVICFLSFLTLILKLFQKSFFFNFSITNNLILPVKQNTIFSILTFCLPLRSPIVFNQLVQP